MTPDSLVQRRLTLSAPELVAVAEAVPELLASEPVDLGASVGSESEPEPERVVEESESPEPAPPVLSLPLAEEVESGSPLPLGLEVEPLGQVFRAILTTAALSSSGQAWAVQSRTPKR